MTEPANDAHPTPKPCPFCGCTDTDLSGGDCDVSVQCCACLADGPVATVGCRSDEELEGVDLEAEAIELWNKRSFGVVK